jgi:cell division protein FtsA
MPAQFQIAAGLDVGSSRTRCVLCALEGDRIRYLSHGLAVSEGWSNSRPRSNAGRVVNQAAVAESMRAAVTDAERDAGVSIESVTLGIGGNHIQGAQSPGQYESGPPREINIKDLQFAADRARKVLLPSDRMLLHALPQDFTLDGRSGYRKPQKSVCSRLEANVHLVTTSVQEHDALVAAAHLAHLPVEEVVFEPLAAAYACLLPEDRARGVAVLDLGMQSTGLVVYDGDAVRIASSIAAFSDDFTLDISSVFRVAYEDAESLKQQYGCARLGLTSESSLIEVPSPEGRPSREERRGELIETLDARAEQLFRLVHAEIQRSGMDRNLFEGIVLTGGGALLPGMEDMAEFVLNCQAGKGLAKGIGDWPKQLEDPRWTVAAGLAMYSARVKLHSAPTRSGGFLGLLMR